MGSKKNLERKSKGIKDNLKEKEWEEVYEHEGNKGEERRERKKRSRTRE